MTQPHFTTTPREYSAYGIPIQSTIPWPELASVEQADPNTLPLTIVERPVPVPQALLDANGGSILAAEGSVFWWEPVGAFFVSPDGSSIGIDRAATASNDLLAFPLFGPVIAEVLRRRGMFTLHASAVSLDGQGIALMADKGTGKSSTAGALINAGARLLADDVVAIDPATAMIKPGFAQIKLEAPSLAHQGERPGWQRREHVHDEIDKTRILVSESFAEADAPASAMYVLNRGTEPQARFEPVSGPDGLAFVLRFSFAPRFGKQALQGRDAETHFRDAAGLSASVPVRILHTPAGLQHLDGIADAIRQDLENLKAGRAQGNG